MLTSLIEIALGILISGGLKEVKSSIFMTDIIKNIKKSHTGERKTKKEQMYFTNGENKRILISDITRNSASWHNNFFFKLLNKQKKNVDH